MVGATTAEVIVRFARESITNFKLSFEVGSNPCTAASLLVRKHDENRVSLGNAMKA
jgi:hypothetical protein